MQVPVLWEQNLVQVEYINFSTRFSCEYFAAEDFVAVFMGEKSFWLGNVWFGHGFDILLQALLCGGDTKFKFPKAGNGDVFFLKKWVGFASTDKAVALKYHYQ